MGFQAVRPGKPHQLGRLAQQVAGTASKGLSEWREQIGDPRPRRERAINASGIVFCCNLSIRSLKLEGNRLQRLHSGDFRGLSCLEELNLQQNQLANLDADVFDDYDYHNLKRSLLKLNLGGNRITTLPNGLFNGLRKLRNLQLQSNQLVRLPQQLFQTLGEVHWTFLEFLKSINPALQPNSGFQGSKVALLSG